MKITIGIPKYRNGFSIAVTSNTPNIKLMIYQGIRISFTTIVVFIGFFSSLNIPRTANIKATKENGNMAKLAIKPASRNHPIISESVNNNKINATN